MSSDRPWKTELRPKWRVPLGKRDLQLKVPHKTAFFSDRECDESNLDYGAFSRTVPCSRRGNDGKCQLHRRRISVLSVHELPQLSGQVSLILFARPLTRQRADKAAAYCHNTLQF